MINNQKQTQNSPDDRLQAIPKEQAGSNYSLQNEDDLDVSQDNEKDRLDSAALVPDAKAAAGMKKGNRQAV